MSRDDDTVETGHGPPPRVPTTSGEQPLQLMIAWSVDDPSRVGEVGRFSDRATLGRGDDGRSHRVRWFRERPGRSHGRPPLDDAHISREQLEVREVDGSWLDVRRCGRRSVRIDGVPLEAGASRRVTVDSRVLIADRLLLLVTRAASLPPFDGALHPFGVADADGIVGESSAAWRLRASILRFGGRDRHVLVTGETGVGKELVARALHRHSARSDGPFVARNAATFPDTLIDAELFGNLRNYPNPGTPNRFGLVGEAHRGTLFLDELGELPRALQAHLLRVLDSGEYQRLGEAMQRRSDLRLIAATNREPERLKHDLAARLVIRVPVVPLRERRRDVPLIFRHLVRRRTESDPELASMVLDDRGEPRIACLLVEALLERPLEGNVRELEQVFWSAVGHTPSGEPLTLPTPRPETPSPLVPRRHLVDVTDTEVVNALRENGWKKEPTWRALGLKDRYELRRLMQRFGITGPGR